MSPVESAPIDDEPAPREAAPTEREEQDAAEPEAAAARRAHVGVSPLVVALWVGVSVSALLFIALVSWPVFDDSNSLHDIERYAAEGVTLQSLRGHVNAPGPVSYVWMAYVGEGLGGGLRGYRTSIWLAWLMLTATYLAAVRWADEGDRLALWTGSLLLLANPYLPTAASTLLTEVPALLFAVTGIILWTRQTERRGAGSMARFVFGGLLCGLAIAARQYFVALLPALLFSALASAWAKAPGPSLGGGPVRDPLRRLVRGLGHMELLARVVGLGLALLPVLFLVVLWEGMTSPGIQTGAVYSLYETDVGFNPLRAFVCMLYVGIYALPLSFRQFPALWRPRAHQQAIFCIAVVLAAVVMGSSSGQDLWRLGAGPGTGPVFRIVSMVDTRSQALGALLSGAFVTIGSFSFLALLTDWVLGWRETRARPLEVAAVVFVLTFIAQQVGVGGNISLYERYILQVVPFLGIAAAGRLPARASVRATILLLPALLGQFMLWRHAFP